MTIRKKNIVYIINGLSLGGGERLLVSMVRDIMLNNQQNNICVFCTTRKGVFEKELSQLQISVHQLTWLGIPLLHNFVKLLFKISNSDVLHTHFFYSDFLGSSLSRIFKIPRLLSTRHETGYWMKKRHCFVEPWIYSKFNKILCVSNAVQNSLIERGIAQEKLVYLPIGLPTKNADTDNSNKLDHITPPYILSVGRLEKVKAHDLLIEAFTQLAEDRKLATLKLVIAGDGAERKALTKLAEVNRIASKCHFLGNVEPDDLPILLKNAALFVLPSHSEALPLALLEAMAAGVPCVGTAVGGIVEVITDQKNGWLVPPNNIQAMKNKLYEILTDPSEHTVLTQNAQKTVCEQFSWQSFINATLSYY